MASSTARQGAYSTRLPRERCVRGWTNQQVIDLPKRPAHERGHARREIQLLELRGVACRADGSRCVVRPRLGVMATRGNRPTDSGPRPSRT
jgi:hypothetical protein